MKERGRERERERGREEGKTDHGLCCDHQPTCLAACQGRSLEKWLKRAPCCIPPASGVILLSASNFFLGLLRLRSDCRGSLPPRESGCFLCCTSVILLQFYFDQGSRRPASFFPKPTTSQGGSSCPSSLCECREKDINPPPFHHHHHHHRRP